MDTWDSRVSQELDLFDPNNSLYPVMTSIPNLITMPAIVSTSTSLGLSPGDAYDKFNDEAAWRLGIPQAIQKNSLSFKNQESP